jgi:hypothetical protein
MYAAEAAHFQSKWRRKGLQNEAGKDGEKEEKIVEGEKLESREQ